MRFNDLNMDTTELVKLVGNEPVTSTLILAEGMKLQHRAVMSLVTKYKAELEEHGFVTFEMSQIKGRGRRWQFAWLNEEQFVFLVTLMRNSENVLKFKSILTREFFKQKKLIAHLLTQRQNNEWLQQREQGKISRRAQTDTIKEFVEYAKAQGSESAKYYYPKLTNMENKALFILEDRYPNVRDVLSGQQLQILASADLTIKRALAYGMEQKMHYRDIYEMAKERIMEFSRLVGKTPVPGQSLQQVSEVPIGQFLLDF